MRAVVSTRKGGVYVPQFKFFLKMLNVCFYITGHGLGHATRSFELLKGLITTGIYIVHVVTNVPESFFQQSFKQSGIDFDQQTFQYYCRMLDAGAVQADALTVDIISTLEKYHSLIHINRDTLLKFEVFLSLAFSSIPFTF